MATGRVEQGNLEVGERLEVAVGELRWRALSRDAPSAPSASPDFGFPAATDRPCGSVAAVKPDFDTESPLSSRRRVGLAALRDGMCCGYAVTHIEHDSERMARTIGGLLRLPRLENQTVQPVHDADGGTGLALSITLKSVVAERGPRIMLRLAAATFLLEL